MSYDDALTAAGAIVHDFHQYGSYQGEWMAHVTLPDGRTGFILDYYGSCSGCDALEALDLDDFHHHDDGTYDGKPLGQCVLCDASRAKLATFGAEFFAQLLTREQAIAYCIDRDYSEYAEMRRDIEAVA